MQYNLHHKTERIRSTKLQYSKTWRIIYFPSLGLFVFKTFCLQVELHWEFGMESRYIGKNSLLYRSLNGGGGVGGKANRFFYLYNCIYTWAFVNTAIFSPSYSVKLSSAWKAWDWLLSIIFYMGVYSSQHLFWKNFTTSNTQVFTGIRQMKFSLFSVWIV